MNAFQQKVHRDLPATYLYGYNNQWPGPTIEARRGLPTSVRWVNYLPASHFLPIDTTIHGAEPGVPAGRGVVHLHGIKVMPDSDGYPEAWYTSDGQTGPAFKGFNYEYPNDQPATTLWYHDHSLGITRVNVAAGLAGAYLLRDSEDDTLPLPRGPYEIPLIIQDRSFNPDGSLWFPDTGVTQTHPVWSPEFFGDVACVNGTAWPYLEVEPRRYRFRIVNGSNARFYNLSFQPSNLEFVQIGSDGGLLRAPVPMKQLLIAPGERADVILDFTRSKGQTFTLLNDALAPYPDGGDGPLPEIMQFRVTLPLQGTDRSLIPSQLASVPRLEPQSAAAVRDLTLEEVMDPVADEPLHGLLDGKMWDAPISETPRAGSIEVWRLINTTGDAHPIHVHLVQFQILDRQPFDAISYGNAIMGLPMGAPRPKVDPYLAGSRVAPPANERGWKDTVRTMPGEVTRIIARFDLPKEAQPARGKRFRYVWHCHILDHEDNEMMRPYDVVA